MIYILQPIMYQSRPMLHKLYRSKPQTKIEKIEIDLQFTYFTKWQTINRNTIISITKDQIQKKRFIKTLQQIVYQSRPMLQKLYITRSLGALPGPNFQLEALRAGLTSAFAPFGRSGRVTHATVQWCVSHGIVCQPLESVFTRFFGYTAAGGRGITYSRSQYANISIFRQRACLITIQLISFP